MINPNYLSIGKNKGQKNKKEKPVIHQSITKPNKIKSALINKIKEHKRKHEGGYYSNEKNEKNEKKEQTLNEFTDEFNQSLDYLQNLIKKKQEKKQRNKTLKKYATKTHDKPTININTSSISHQNKSQQSKQLPQLQHKQGSNISYTSSEPLPSLHHLIQKKRENNYQQEQRQQIQQRQQRQQRQQIPNKIEYSYTKPNSQNKTLKKEPPYGNLKQGNKPTYRSYIRLTDEDPKITALTKKNTELNSKLSSFLYNNENKKERKERYLGGRKEEQIYNPIVNSINTPLTIDNNSSLNNQNKIERKEKLKKYKTKIRRKTIRRRHKLGKSNKKIGVLIKNHHTRKRIEKERNQLNYTSMYEVKDYLRRHGLLKIGSTAPDYLLRNIYNDCKMAGEVNNNSSDVLIHNYINEEV